jgi:hypothetical protein
MTTASFTASGSRLYHQTDRFAGTGFFRALLDRLLAGRQREAQALLARTGGQRWCDSTERRLIDGFTRHPDSV